MRLYVDANAKETGNGAEEAPFRTIQEAADAARPGDEVLVLPGVYRENVSPVFAGTPEKRITYRSTEPLAAVITGAESAKGWKREGGSVWSFRIPNSRFPERNPFATRISGDWFIADFVAHTGEVYLNGKSLYEVTTPEAGDADTFEFVS